jgi:hypothetical protein
VRCPMDRFCCACSLESCIPSKPLARFLDL